MLAGAQVSDKLDLSKADVNQKTITADGQKIELTIVRPAGAKGILPVFIFHGGGWVLGDYPPHERLIRNRLVGSGAAAVFVNSTPSPEAHYPTAIKKAYAATKWVAHDVEQTVVMDHPVLANHPHRLKIYRQRSQVGQLAHFDLPLLAQIAGEPGTGFIWYLPSGLA